MTSIQVASGGKSTSVNTRTTIILAYADERNTKKWTDKCVKDAKKGKARGWRFPCVSQTDSWAQGQRWSGDGLWPLLPETLASYLGMDKKWNKSVVIGIFMALQRCQV